jgi:L-threonylcarbamoyladenylate synthase
MSIRLTVDRHRPDPDALARAARLILSGGLVAYPTDTLYGLAGDPANDAAMERLFEAKGRDLTVAIPLIAADLEQVRAWVGGLSATAFRLADAFWPGPLTLVVPAPHRFSPRLLGGGVTVAIRVPAHAVAAGLARACGRPITSTSANLTGGDPPSRPDAIDERLSERLDLVLDAGPCAGGAPSTIVDVAGDVPQLVRGGAIAWERVLESLRK